MNEVFACSFDIMHNVGIPAACPWRFSERRAGSEFVFLHKVQMFNILWYLFVCSSCYLDPLSFLPDDRLTPFNTTTQMPVSCV